jgi:radical SAM-linked protein
LARNGDTQPSEPRRYAVDFCVDGDIKYLSHRDMIRMFSRALARAELPVRYSEGFNPHPRVSLPLPRPVGIASDAERLVLELTGAVSPPDLERRLQGQMPRGIRIAGARETEPSERCLPRRVTYRVQPPDFEPLRFAEAIRRLLGPDVVHVERSDRTAAAPRRVDIRPFIDDVTMEDDGIVMTILVTGKGSARPAEVCRALGLQGDAINQWIRRIEVEWQ